MSEDDSDFFAAPNPDARLYVSVLALAWQDLFESPGACNHPGERKKARAESLRLLTDDVGEWAEHRNWLASMAGVDGDVLRERTLRQMQLTPPAPIYIPDLEVQRARKREAQRRRHEGQRAAKGAQPNMSPTMADAAE